MLEISNIKKDYQLKDEVVHALNGVSISFRRNEFVSILGPSGCGKTTLLNIIGGLDRYTDGDLIIEGKSTKEFKDKDWDNYRNHRVGFVFQSYNLIPHQTVLQNVELALTLSGVSKKERKARATEVLEKVGLGDKLKVKPNQLSGGQMQRVAIARALVNDPEIILADEPTGALDSKTSVQIMEILKEVSENRLVIMVTHNPDLAEKYSSRIIRLLDGELTEDTKPYTHEQAEKDLEKHKKEQEKQAEKQEKTFNKTDNKKSMSFFTALALSFKNLLTKKARTILVSFAGSIGIIGIALILAISSGFSTYINKMQEDTLSTYPITIESKSVDFTSVIMDMFMDTSSSDDINHDKDAVYPKDSITNVLDSIGNSLESNNLTKFYSYLNENYSDIEDHVNAVQYTYDISLEFYTGTDVNVQPNSNAIMQMVNKYSMFFFENKTKVRVTPNPNGSYLVEKIDGVQPDYDAFVRLYPELAFVEATLEANGEMTFSSSQVTYLTFTLLDMDMSGGGMGSMMSASFGNMNIFNEMLNNDELIQAQYDLLGEESRFAENPNEALLVLDKNHEVDEYMLYALGLLGEEDMDNIIKAKIKGDTYKVGIDYSEILGTRYKVIEECDYFVEMSDGSVVDIRTYADKDHENFDMAKYATYYAQVLANCTNEVEIVGIVRLNDKTSTGSLSTGIAYTHELTRSMVNHYNSSQGVASGDLEPLDLGTPKTINIYVTSFESKEHIQNFIKTYNNQAEEGDEIKYTDLVGVIMSTVSVIINSITYVLIAFVSVSLVVSSIMIGIITYISVIERTKEIGVLRSVGASKRDIKHVFTAESFIIGLTSGVFGILVTLIFIIPINILLKSFTGISGLAALPVVGAIVLIAISVLLTFIAGLFPAHIASKKDPVIALRTE